MTEQEIIDGIGNDTLHATIGWHAHAIAAYRDNQFIVMRVYGMFDASDKFDDVNLFIECLKTVAPLDKWRRIAPMTRQPFT